MHKDVLIKIKGTQIVDGDKEVVELTTLGKYYKKNNHYYISYNESEVTGFKGTKTTLKVNNATNRITLLRFGQETAQFTIEKGIRHQCQYGTEYGNLMIGVLGSKVVNHLNDSGGNVLFQYSLDINTSLASENEVYITIEECKN